MSNHIYLNKKINTPNTLNILIALAAISISIFLIHTASHTQNIYSLIGCVILFSFVGNTIFGLLHEAVHNGFSDNKVINYIFGNILASFFPTGFTFQKRCHLNHHRQNRTDFEMFEAYHDNDSKFVKTVMLYFILTGIYWTNPGMGAVWLMIHPQSLLNSPFSGKNNYEVGRMGGAGMLRHLENLPNSEMLKMRLEVLFTILFQLSIFYFFNFSFKGWILCYIGFAIQWSGLQYADHAYSARDIRNGAWNLKVSWFTQVMFLNYHHHLAHHQHPHVSWIHLGKFVDKNEDRPSFWSIYLRMWKGLEKVNQEAPKPIDPELDQLLSSPEEKSIPTQ